MNFDELQKVWSQQPVPPAQNPTAEAALLARIRDDAARFERNYWRKDFLDIVIVLVACFTMACISRMHASPLRVLSALVFLPIPVCLLVSRWKNRRICPQQGDDLKQAIANALLRLRHRRDLMRIYIWVCIGSLVCANVLSQIHSHVHAPSADQTQHSLAQAAFVLAVSALMLLGNRNHIKIKIDPQITDLEEQQRLLLPPEESAS